MHTLPPAYGIGVGNSGIDISVHIYLLESTDFAFWK